MKIFLYVLIGLLVAAIVAGVVCRRFIVGLWKYGGQAREGTLAVGDPAPDVTLVNLDGTTRQTIHDHMTGKPLVLVFGSFT